MDGGLHGHVGDDKRPDLLAHRYRPRCSDKFRCHPQQALRLKQWIQEFIGSPDAGRRTSEHSDDDCDSTSGKSDNLQIASKCVLLTGPPGVGKTSLVYTVANELKMHVVESHPSEKRDFKLFGMLKLANQKGKINPIAKLFQGAQQQQQEQSSERRRKRRKLAESNVINKPAGLSLTGHSSIVLFDDIDVVFEDDGPFLKSLVEFIRESKRPVVLTATRSLDYIADILINFEHIHLHRPVLEDCATLLSEICRSENYKKLSSPARCRTIADQADCDIRQCLNRIQFYEDKADQVFGIDSYGDQLRPKFSSLNLEDLVLSEPTLNCYATSCVVDIMDNEFRTADRLTLRKRWLDGKPSFGNEERNLDHDLGEQIRESIVELTKAVMRDQVMTCEELNEERKKLSNLGEEFLFIGEKINSRIKSRIEPPERDFFTDMVPFLGEMVTLETRKRASGGGGMRRGRRFVSYMDSIGVYFDLDELVSISDSSLGYETVQSVTLDTDEVE